MCLLALLFGFSCSGSLGGRLITKSDLILDFVDITEGVRLSIKKIREGTSRGNDVLMEESSQGSSVTSWRR